MNLLFTLYAALQFSNPFILPAFPNHYVPPTGAQTPSAQQPTTITLGQVNPGQPSYKPQPDGVNCFSYTNCMNIHYGVTGNNATDLGGQIPGGNK